MPPCRIPGVELVVAETDHAFPRHTHDRFGIGVITRGAQRSLSGRGIVEAGPGDVVTVNPGEVHDGVPIGRDARTWRTLYLEPALVAAAIGDFAEGGSTAQEITQPVFVDAPLASRVRGLIASAVSPKATEAAEAFEERLLLVLAAVMQERMSPHPASSTPNIAAALQMIEDDPAAPHRLSDLARATGLTRFQVMRAFAKATGLTPHAHLVQQRAHLARRLIARGTALAEASVAAGFADQSHMTRILVRQFGVTPKAYAAATR